MDAVYLSAALAFAALGHPDFATREHASYYLRQLGPLAYAHSIAGKKSADQEVISRCGVLVYSISCVWAEEAADTVRSTRFSNRLPWIDGLSQDVDNRYEIISAYLDYAKEKHPQHVEMQRWWYYRVATREYCRDLFAAGASWESVTAMLDVMADAELKWIEANKKDVAELLLPAAK